MDRRVFAALLALLLVSAPALHSLPAALPVYQVEDLGTTADGLVPTVTGVNAAGQVSGYVSTPAGLRAVRFASGLGWAYLPGLQSVFSVATAINASGDLTGYYMPAAGLRAYRYGDSVGLTTIEALPGGTFTIGQAIAADGEVVGYGNSSAGQRAWRTGPGLGVLPFVPQALSAATSSACGVNSAGQLVGSFTTSGGDHAFRLESNGSLTDIGTLGGPTSSACALDGDGRVGGQSATGTATHAFLFASAISDVDAFNSTVSRVAAIANGVAVGTFNSATSAGARAFVSTNTGGATDLNTRIPADSGWVLRSAAAVSTTGQIVGQGLFNGTPRAFRLSPGATADTTAPVITSMTATPSSITPPNRALVPVTVAVSATDDVDAAPSCGLSSISSAGAPATDYAITAPLSAAVRAVGGRTYSLTVTCIDAAGNAATRSVDVVVPPDTTPPVVTTLTVTPSVVWPPNDALVAVTVAVSASDDSAEVPSCALSGVTASGSTADDYSITGQYSANVRAVGGRTYSLRVTCSDAAGNRREASVGVVVPADTTAPVITGLSASPDHIWPPNSKMEKVTLSVTATDDVDAAPNCTLTSITGAPAADVLVTGPLTANVRAEKDAVYTFNVGCRDKAGNKSQASVHVAVSKDSPSPSLARSRKR